MKTSRRTTAVVYGVLAIAISALLFTASVHGQTPAQIQDAINQLRAQRANAIGGKFCVATSKAGWRATLNVPNDFTARGCEDYSRQIGADDYVLGCVQGTDQVSVGTGGPGVIGHGSPSPNCGW